MVDLYKYTKMLTQNANKKAGSVIAPALQFAITL